MKCAQYCVCIRRMGELWGRRKTHRRKFNLLSLEKDWEFIKKLKKKDIPLSKDKKAVVTEKA